MRTTKQIKNNSTHIFNLMANLHEQISLLENEYQTNAIQCTGSRNEDWDNDIANLTSAIASLNTLAHMEIDYASDLDSPDED